MWSVKSLEKTHWNNFGLNWFGREKNQTKINLFEPVFGSVQKLKKNFGLIVYFGPKPDRIENAQP
jgi:hypothetical protein